MLGKLEYEDFTDQLNTKFKLTDPDLELELVEIGPKTETERQVMFSLFFRGAKDNFIEQRIYQMSHEKLGEGELFLVPVGLDEEGYLYESGFNRLKPEQ